MPVTKAQSILDFILAFIAIVALSVGIVRVWVWFNANYAKAQVDYQQTREAAGKDSPGQPPSRDTLALNEEWVFKGNPSGSIGGHNMATPEEVEDTCQQQCQSQCTSGGVFDENCTCYAKCLCWDRVTPIAQGYKDQAGRLRDIASQLDDVKEELYDAAEDCDDEWEICWYYGMGKTSDELKKAARKLKRERDRLKGRANDSEAVASRLEDCCENHSSRQAQQDCIDEILNGICAMTIDGISQGWKDLSEGLGEDKNAVISARNTFNQKISDCEQIAIGQCTYPDYEDGPDVFHPSCYTAKYDQINNCCTSQGACPRKCYTPDSPCDTNVSGNCPTDPCGLTEMVRRRNCEINNYYNVIIPLIEQYAVGVSNCCNVCNPGDSGQVCYSKQMDCITSYDTNFDQADAMAQLITDSCINSGP